MITENKPLSADALKDLRLATIAQLAEEESRNKSRRCIYEMPSSRYTEIMKLNESLEPKELGYGFKLDVRKRGIE